LYKNKVGVKVIKSSLVGLIVNCYEALKRINYPLK